MPTRTTNPIPDHIVDAAQNMLRRGVSARSQRAIADAEQRVREQFAERTAPQDRTATGVMLQARDAERNLQRMYGLGDEELVRAMQTAIEAGYQQDLNAQLRRTRESLAAGFIRGMETVGMLPPGPAIQVPTPPRTSARRRPAIGPAPAWARQAPQTSHLDCFGNPIPEEDEEDK